MSAARAYTRPPARLSYRNTETVGEPETTKPKLKVIEKPAVKAKSTPKIKYAVTVLLGLLTIALSQLVLSIFLTQDAYEISSLQDEKVQVEKQLEATKEDLLLLSSPQFLMEQAKQLGMVPAQMTGFIRLSDGKIIKNKLPADWAKLPSSSYVPNALLSSQYQELLAKNNSSETSVAGTLTPIQQEQPQKEIKEKPQNSSADSRSNNQQNETGKVKLRSEQGNSGLSQKE